MVIKGAATFGQTRSTKRRADSGTRDGITTNGMDRLMNVLVACHRKLRTVFVTNAWAVRSWRMTPAD